MNESKRVRSGKATVESNGSSGWCGMYRLFFHPSKHVTALVFACAIAMAFWWWFPRPITLFTPVAISESYAIGTPVLLDDDTVGRVDDIRRTTGGAVAELRLSWLSAGQRRKIKDGLVRMSGTRAVWLTSEFIDASGPPLVNGDVVPVISRAERDNRKAAARFASWLLPGSGIGLLFLLWRGVKRLFA